MAISGLGDISSLWATIVKEKKRQDLPGTLLAPAENSPVVPASDFASMVSGRGSAGETQGTSGAVNTQSTTAMAKPVKGESPTEDFLNYMKMTPEQRAQYKWLAAHGITKEKYEAMTVEEKRALMEQMRQEIEDQIRRNAEQGNKPVIPVNILA